MRQNAVAAGMPGEEVNLAPGEFAADKGIRRIAERRADRVFTHIFNAIDLIKAAASDDADIRIFAHSGRKNAALTACAQRFPQGIRLIILENIEFLYN